MPTQQFTTPVAFIVFNRPDTTREVFREIARAKPSKLLVIADGPRANRPGEEARCLAARAVIKEVDWDCDVLQNYSDVNLGCKNRVASGIDWVFEQVPEAIILEDDCLPHPTFFRFCQELLEHYRDDERIAMISGDNFQFGRQRGDGSYYFSKYMHIWGWASWRRAWQYYDRSASNWPTLRLSGIVERMASNSYERQHWNQVFQSVHDGLIDTWDYQWTLAAWAKGMISVMPNVNLISNIGFGVEATHTRERGMNSNLPVSAMKFPLRHPSTVEVSRDADRFAADNMFIPSLPRRAVRYLKRIIG